MRAGGVVVGAAFSRDKTAGGHHRFIAEHSLDSVSLEQMDAKSELSRNLANSVCPAWGFSEIQPMPTQKHD